MHRVIPERHAKDPKDLTPPSTPPSSSPPSSHPPSPPPSTSTSSQRSSLAHSPPKKPSHQENTDHGQSGQFIQGSLSSHNQLLAATGRQPR